MLKVEKRIRYSGSTFSRKTRCRGGPHRPTDLWKRYASSGVSFSIEVFFYRAITRKLVDEFLKDQRNFKEEYFSNETSYKFLNIFHYVKLCYVVSCSVT